MRLLLLGKVYVEVALQLLLGRMGAVVDVADDDAVLQQGDAVTKTTRMLAQKQPYIQRVRNSSLVERSCAENVRG